MRFGPSLCDYSRCCSTCLQIINNYVGQSNDTPPFANAEDAFRIYNADGNYEPRVPGQHYYDFRYGDVAYFVMDTRRHRSNPHTDEPATRTMLGDTQLSALYEWLGKVCLKCTSWSPTSRPILIIRLFRSIRLRRSNLSSRRFRSPHSGRTTPRSTHGPVTPPKKPPCSPRCTQSRMCTSYRVIDTSLRLSSSTR
jgi:hypothetical protein